MALSRRSLRFLRGRFAEDRIEHMTDHRPQERVLLAAAVAALVPPLNVEQFAERAVVCSQGDEGKNG